MIAPIVIAALLLVYYAGFAIACITIADFPRMVMLLFGIVPLALAGVCIWMLVERIKEIRSGEEDDLSQY